MADQFTPPDKNKIVRTTSIPQEKEPPKEVLNQTFSIDLDKLHQDGSISAPVQLPEMDRGEGKPADDAQTGTELPKKPDTTGNGETGDQKVSKALKPPSGKPEVKPGEKKEEVIKPIVPPSKDKIQRDYTGYSPEEIAVFKQMSDAAYKYTTDLIKKSKEATSQAQTPFYQHPEAYTITPEYKAAQADVYFAQAEGQAWKQALANIKAGKPFQQPTGVNTKTGELVMSGDIPPTDEYEETVRANMMKCFNVAQERQQSLGNFQKQYQEQVKKDLAAIENERAKRFSWVQDPKYLDYTVNIEGFGDVPIKQMRQDFISLFPSYLRNHPATEVAADLMVAIRVQYAELQELKAASQQSELLAEELKRGEPTSKIRPTPQDENTLNNKIGKVKSFSLDGMPS